MRYMVMIYDHSEQIQPETLKMRPPRLGGLSEAEFHTMRPLIAMICFNSRISLQLALRKQGIIDLKTRTRKFVHFLVFTS